MISIGRIIGVLSFILLVVLISVETTNRSYAFESEPDGFRGIAWGTPFETVKNQMQFFDSPSAFDSMLRKVDPKLDSSRSVKPREVSYLRKKDSAKLGGAEVHAVFYMFYKGKFAKSSMASHENDAFIAAFHASFGEPTEENNRGSLWQGAKTRIELGCTWKECDAILYSVPLLAEKLADDAALANDAKKAF